MTRGDGRFEVVGDSLVDVVVTPASDALPGADVAASIVMLPGGQGANVAVRLARLGSDVVLRTRIGSDRLGALLRAALAADGVRVVAGAAGVSGSVAIVVDPEGGRTMYSQRPSLAGVPVAGAGAWLVVSGYALLDPDARGLATRAAATPARRALLGCEVPPAGLEDWTAAARALRPDLLILNAREGHALSPAGGDGGPLAASLAAEFGALVVMTAAVGAAAARPDADGVEVPFASHGQPVDTTGAGDAFAARLLLALGGAPWPPANGLLHAALVAAGAHATAVAGVAGAQGRVAGERPAVRGDDGTLDA